MNIINIIHTEAFNNITKLLARFALAALFILTGLSKVEFYDATAQYMATMGVPGVLLPLVIALEVIGGAMVVLGLLTRLTALAFATINHV